MIRALLVVWGVLMAFMVAMSFVGCGGCQTRIDPSPATGGTGAGGSSNATGGSMATGGTSSTGGSPGTGGAPSPADDCEAAEWRIRDLGCLRESDGKPRWLTPGGIPLSVVCRDRAADNDPICPACLARIATCDGIDACRPRSPGVCP